MDSIGEQIPNFPSQRRKVSLHYSPNQLCFDFEVIVNENIAEAHRLRPYLIGVFRPELTRQPTGSFAYDLKMMEHPHLQHFVGVNSLP